MRCSLGLLLCWLGFSPVLASAQLIGVPSPGNSTTPACLALCPLGDMPLTVVVRDLANVPIAGSTVVLDFSQCPSAHLCEWWPTDPYTVNTSARWLIATTGPNGSVTIPARVGGTGAAGAVRLFADGVFLKAYALASPDQNGNGYVYEGFPVGGNDLALFGLKLGTADPTADFTCDGVVNPDDQEVIYGHYAQSCAGVVPVKQSTWGELKTHYR